MFKNKELAKKALMSNKDLTEEEKSDFIKHMDTEGFKIFTMIMDSIFLYGRITCMENLIDTFQAKHKHKLDESITYRDIIRTLKAMKAFEEAEIEEAQ